MEDYALRFPRSVFINGPGVVANGVWGGLVLILEAVGAALLVKYGFANAFWAHSGLQPDHLFWPVCPYLRRPATGWT
jgi:hypothetical protein